MGTVMMQNKAITTKVPRVACLQPHSPLFPFLPALPCPLECSFLSALPSHFFLIKNLNKIFSICPFYIGMNLVFKSLNLVLTLERLEVFRLGVKRLERFPSSVPPFLPKHSRVHPSLACESTHHWPASSSTAPSRNSTQSDLPGPAATALRLLTVPMALTTVPTTHLPSTNRTRSSSVTYHMLSFTAVLQGLISCPSLLPSSTKALPVQGLT